MSTPDDETTHDGDVVDVDEQPVMRPHRKTGEAEPGDFASVPGKHGPDTQKIMAITGRMREQIEAEAKRRAMRWMWVKLGSAGTVLAAVVGAIAQMGLFSFKDGLPFPTKEQFNSLSEEVRAMPETFVRILDERDAKKAAKSPRKK